MNEVRTSALRISPWPNDALARAAVQLAPVPGSLPPTPAEIRSAVDDLAHDGFAHAITVALAPAEQAPFLEAGFGLREHLHLLTHDLRAVAPRSGARTRRPRRADWDAIIETDRRAFSDFWRLDRGGLAQAMAATPVRRLRVIEDDQSGEVVGYALTGRAGLTGYLQRLAVRPSHHRQGYGRALALDSLHWLRRHRAERVLVNTQVTNTTAFHLYLDLGFAPDAAGLAVLALPLGAGVPE